MTDIDGATGILHSNVTVQTACRLHRAVPQGYCTVLVLCRQTAQSCATGTLHSIGAVQTACRLHRAVLQGYCTVLVLGRQPADCTELCYRDIAQYYYTQISCVLVQCIHILGNALLAVYLDSPRTLLRCVSTLLYTSRSPGQICIGGITTMELRRAWEELLSELLQTGNIASRKTLSQTHKGPGIFFHKPFRLKPWILS